jgi:hypothetical protein
MALPALSTDLQPAKYYPKIDSSDAEDMALINKMHAIFVNDLASHIQPGSTITFPEYVEYTIPVTRLDPFSQQHVFSKGYDKKDAVTIQLSIKDVARRLIEVLEGCPFNINYFQEKNIENLTEQKRKG